jgi:Bax protein
MRKILIICLFVLSAPVAATGDWGSTSVHTAGAQVRQKPDFSRILDVSQKKQRFFEYLMPHIHKANQSVLRDRANLLSIETRLIAGQALTTGDRATVQRLSAHYKLKRHATTDDLTTIKSLLSRIDVLPLSLVLAQAANESGWGTSRFAVQANNYFGMWCYQKGCGLAPRQRDPGQNHEVKAFDTVQSNIEAYILNINTHPAYQPLRTLRQTLRELGAPLRGVLLAEGLMAYSSRGKDYIADIQALITANDLDRLAIELVSN